MASFLRFGRLVLEELAAGCSVNPAVHICTYFIFSVKLSWLLTELAQGGSALAEFCVS